MIQIYALIDPLSRLVRYVGKARDAKRRLRSHIERAHDGQCHSKRWIASLLDRGERPTLNVLEICEDELANDRERYWIAYFRRFGYDLTNTTDGGDGQAPGYQWSEEARRKLGATTKGRKKSEATKAKMRAAFNKPEERERRRQRTLELSKNPEWRWKIGSGNRGKSFHAMRNKDNPGLVVERPRVRQGTPV